MNTKLLKTTIVMSIVLLLASACGLIPTIGSRNVISETRQVSGYDRVEVSGGGTLEIVQDGTESLTVETDDNMMQFVTSEVRGGTLHVGLNSIGRALLPSRLNLTLHVKTLGGVVTSGSWDVHSTQLDTNDLTILISGSGKMTVDTLSASSLESTISGSGTLNLTGKVDNQTIGISGSGKYMAGNLNTQTSSVTISGSGTVTVWAIDSLTVRVSGSGNVSYYGSPQVNFNQSGSGSIHNLGVK